MWIYYKVFLIAFIIFIFIDLLWLGLIAKSLYQRELGHLMKQNINFIVAIIFYLIFVIALSVFVIVPGIEGESIVKVILLGALFGFASYATYDLTNYATIEGFPLKMVIIDLIWGSSLGTLTSLLTFLIYKGVFK
jgi:uncharacterized membrane protein